VEEISKAVPGTRVLLSKGGSRLDVLPKLVENVLVISTYGCEPDGEYAGIVLRSLENLTNRIDLRSLEFVRRLVFENLGKVSNSDGGYVYVDLPASHPFSQGLLRADPMGLSNLEMAERKSSNLPPYTRVATITGEGAAVRVLANQIKENDLFASVSVISNTSGSGASSKSINSSKLILRASIENSAQFSEFLRDVARYRSLKGLSPLSIRIDPYSI
jgi:primosomal protein N'